MTARRATRGAVAAAAGMLGAAAVGAAGTRVALGASGAQPPGMTWRTIVARVTGEVLFHPAASDAAPGTSYTRVIRLAHNGPANGRLLATFEYHGSGGFPIFESRDDGRTWSPAPVGTVRGTIQPPASGWRFEWQPTLYELPVAVGDLPAGTILLAGNDVNFADAQNDALRVYASTDLGRTWRYRGTTESSPPHGGGVWEPELEYSGGRLVAYYSSERHKDRGYNQFLAHRTSTDGGRSWGGEVLDVAVPDRVHRPGMAVVSRLPGGRYLMSYEVCGPDARCPVAVKLSPDGLHWGDPADLGQPVRTADGAVPLGTPYNAWVPAGGPNGTVLLSSRDVEGKAGTRVLFASRDSALREWRAVAAPVQWQGGNDHAAWSHALVATADGRGVLHLVSSAFGDGRRNEVRYARAAVGAP